MNESVPVFRVLGANVHAVNMDTAIDAIVDAISNDKKGYVVLSGAHGIMESRWNPDFRNVINGAMLSVPDGMPLVWIGKHHGYPAIGRVYGPDLMLELCRLSVKKGWTHFLYGGRPGVVEDLKVAMERKFPGIRIVGAFCPPFCQLSEKEEAELKRSVSAVRPQFFWVGLSTPKQDRFMAKHLSTIDTNVMLGVGAAFDMHTGRQKDAPSWIKRAGLQWLYRVCQEPLRLGRRYFKVVPCFVVLETLELLGVMKFDEQEGVDVGIKKSGEEKYSSDKGRSL